MSQRDLELVQARMELRNEDALRLARTRALLQQAGLEQAGMASRLAGWLRHKATAMRARQRPSKVGQATRSLATDR